MLFLLQPNVPQDYTVLNSSKSLASFHSGCAAILNLKLCIKRLWLTDSVELWLRTGGLKHSMMVLVVSVEEVEINISFVGT